jgi:hypothetical protein
MPTTIDADSNVTETRTCPLCNTPLDHNNPNECPRCDWTLGYRRRKAAPLGGGKFRDVAAVVLSLVPGLGHIYKGHVLTGLLLVFGAVAWAFAGALAATETMGLALFLLPVYWIAVMMHVYWLDDLGTPTTDPLHSH